MTLHEEVLAFSREYVNKPRTRTSERKRKIKEVYVQVFGTLFNLKCGSCYIAAILKLVNQNKPKTLNQNPVIKQKVMTHNYQLKPGALLKAFNDKSKFATNANLTDELAEWHLAHNPASAKLFSKMPANVQIQPVSNLAIVQVQEPVKETVVIPPVEPEIVPLPEPVKVVHKEIKKRSPRKTKK